MPLSMLFGTVLKVQTRMSLIPPKGQDSCAETAVHARFLIWFERLDPTVASTGHAVASAFAPASA